MKLIKGVNAVVDYHKFARLAGVCDTSIHSALTAGRLERVPVAPENFKKRNAPTFHLLNQKNLDWMYIESRRDRQMVFSAKEFRLEMGLPKEKAFEEVEIPDKGDQNPSPTTPKHAAHMLLEMDVKISSIESAISDLKSTQDALLSLMGSIEAKVSEAIAYKRKCEPIKDVGDASKYDEKSCEQMLVDLENVPENERTVYTTAWLKTISGWYEKGNELTIKHKQIILATWISQFQN